MPRLHPILGGGFANNASNVTSPRTTTSTSTFIHHHHHLPPPPSSTTKLTMIGTDDVEVIRTAFASVSLDSTFAAPFADKYITRESISLVRR